MQPPKYEIGNTPLLGQRMADIFQVSHFFLVRVEYNSYPCCNVVELFCVHGCRVFEGTSSHILRVLGISSELKTQRHNDYTIHCATHGVFVRGWNATTVCTSSNAVECCDEPQYTPRTYPFSHWSNTLRTGVVWSLEWVDFVGVGFVRLSFYSIMWLCL